ncbi:Transcriptional regulator PadR-like family protein [Paenibacillus tianmuensis]|uniref:Transcriptional regulator PadR-like family protein n=2 Tax=Paenibacillus tianmuensis TaxID=624147 RepID=A0A1G4PLU3_9BACL|nr:Transcriptional regulator PadR-like family protein [Paenibacillus tianmuensis]
MFYFNRHDGEHRKSERTKGQHMLWLQEDHRVRYKRGRSSGGCEEGKQRFFKRGEFKYALLELLVSEPMHGYQLIKAMEDRTGGLYVPSAGSIYPNLQLLEDMSLITAKEANGKRLYRITEAGLVCLQERKSRDQDCWEREGRRRPDADLEKSDLREMMKEWSEVIFLIARAAKKSGCSPEQYVKFRGIIEKLQLDLTQLLDGCDDTLSEDNRS